jgi:hypothetical protein
MTDASIILKGFNDHFIEFIDDIIRVLPNNMDMKGAKKSFALINFVNPKLIIKVWKINIIDKYSDILENSDINFIINKDYSEDLVNADNSAETLNIINRLREPLRSMNKSDQDKSMKYIQNLKKLCCLYHELI